MAFTGTQQKCKACDKTVYPMDQLTADGVVFHKSCFRCNQCKRMLKLGDFASFESALYCKAHFEQLLKRTGTFKHSVDMGKPSAPYVQETEATPSAVTATTVDDDTDTPAPVSAPTLDTAAPAPAPAPIVTQAPAPAPTPAPAPATAVAAVRDSPRKLNRVSTLFSGTQEKCVVCSKTVYPVEKVSVEGASYHKVCFRCSHGGCSISPSNYAALAGRIYCKHHFSQLFKEKGSYNQIASIPSMKQKQELQVLEGKMANSS